MYANASISDWYSGRRVLVTGATGFMGKVLVEKLLRSCPKIEVIYLLVRCKRGRDPCQRLEDFVNSPVFDKLHDRPDGEEIFEKLRCVCGDITQNNLGLSLEDAQNLRENVDVVFHMAANVRFDQPLKPVLLMNTGGTLRMLDLACTFKKLKAFIHVSTSYCHCDETELEEKTYPAPHNPRKILDMVNWMEEDLINHLTPSLIKNAPNTYAYTKCLTEQLVSEYASKIPVLIARPSIVSAAWQEPIPGWVDNLNGPTGLLVGAGKGVIRSMHCNPQLEADVVPVDVAINSLIILGWKLGTSSKNEEVSVYNVTANRENRIKWGDALEKAKKHFFNNPFSVCLWYPGGSIKSSYIIHMLCVFFFHIIPAYLIDFLLTITRNKPFLVRTQKRIQNGLEVLQYYTTRPWYFHNDKLKMVWDNLSTEDQKLFYTDKYFNNWDAYLLAYILGARKYCVHEEPDTIPYARKVLRRLYYLDMTKNIMLAALLLWIFSSYASLIFNKADVVFETISTNIKKIT